jgi:putative transposase
MAKSTRGVRRGRRTPNVVAWPADWQRLWRDRPPELSRRAQARLAMLDWHRAHGASVSLTARHFGYSRPTVYRWLGRFDRFHLEALEDRPPIPRRRRRPSWTLEQLTSVRELRRRYPRWGKDKLVVLLRREGTVMSSSMVGRVIARLRRSGELVEPVGRRISARKRRWPRPYAVRKPRDYVARRPGDLVQLDTLDVRAVAGSIWKQFTARDVVSRWDVVELAPSASARHAVRLLDALARMPFEVRALSVDNGSEFMADFELECRRRGIALLTLPPRSPKLNAFVERSNRTHTEEFYEVTDAAPELADFQRQLACWELTYNTVRPHQALGYLTPAEFLASLKPDV